MGRISTAAVSIAMLIATVWSAQAEPSTSLSKAAPTPSTSEKTAAPPSSAKAPNPASVVIRIESWAGAYGKAQEIAVLSPLRKALGFSFEKIARTSGMAFSPNTDVVEVDQATLYKGCASGKFLSLGDLFLHPARDGTPTNEDFLPGALSKCGVGTFAWSALIVADSTKFKRRQPKTLQDVFNARRFRGKRAFLTNTPYIITMTALASGISPAEVYQSLETREGADRAFSKLESLRRHIIWADSPKVALSLLDAGTATMAMSFSGRTFRRTITGHLRTIWDGHIYDFASWAIPVGTKHHNEAKRFIAAATTTDRLATQATHWPYGPMRKSAIALATHHALIDLPLAPHLPTSGTRLKAGVRFDAAFWARNQAYYKARLDAFREGFKYGVRIPIPARAPERLSTDNTRPQTASDG